MIRVEDAGLTTVTIIDDSCGTAFRLCVATALEFAVAQYLPTDSAGRFHAEAVIADRDGFTIVAPKAFLRNVPDRWEAFFGKFCSPDLSVTGQRLVDLYARYVDWGKEAEARIAVRAVAEGENTWEEIGRAAPYLSDHLLVQQAAAKSALFPAPAKKRLGRPPKSTRQSGAIQELLAWIPVYRAIHELTLEGAIDCALSNHPTLVPARWKEPHGALAQAYKRWQVQRRLRYKKSRTF